MVTMPLQPIHVPEEWHDHDLLTFEQFCNLIHTPPRTVRDWRRRGIGPRWTKLEDWAGSWSRRRGPAVPSAATHNKMRVRTAADGRPP